MSCLSISNYLFSTSPSSSSNNAGTTMMALSLGLNSFILTPLTLSLYLKPNSVRHTKVLGPDTQSRRILCAMYTSINVMSVMTLGVLFFTTTPNTDNGTTTTNKATMLAVPIFASQIVYKTITAIYNKGWTPVIYANQFVTVFHLATLATMWQTGTLDVYLK